MRTMWTLRRISRVAGLSLLLLFLSWRVAGAGARPPAPAAPAAPVFGERIDVRAVNVEAVVTDRSGNRVQGLSAGDFQLRVDGREVKIDYFAEVADGRKAGDGKGGTPTPPAAGEGAVGTSYLVFVDNGFSVVQDRNAVLQHLAGDLGRLGPGDQMAIVAFDGRKLVPLSSWSGDAPTLAAALQKAQAMPSLGLHARDERRSFSGEQALRNQVFDDTVHPQVGGQGSDDAADATFSDLSSRGNALTGATGLVHRAVPGRCVEEFPISPLQCVELQEAINAAAAALRGVPNPGGRKVALLLSGGWPYGAGPHLYKGLLDTADQLGYTLYPVDVAGIDKGDGVVDAALEAPAANTGFVSGAWNREGKDTLEYLAAATGGKAMLNSARLDALQRTVADTRSFYWLGFSPVWRADDRGHRIEVTVRRPGLSVRARSAFTDLSTKAEDAMRAESALLLGGAAEHRRLRIETGPPKLRRGDLEVPITLAVPVSALTLTADGSGYLAEATLSFAVQDDAGGRASLPQVPLRLRLPGAPAPGSYARYRTTVRLRRTGQTLVALLRDRESGAILWDEKAIAEDGK